VGLKADRVNVAAERAAMAQAQERRAAAASSSNGQAS
jgi:hypothetical protein